MEDKINGDHLCGCYAIFSIVRMNVRLEEGIAYKITLRFIAMAYTWGRGVKERSENTSEVTKRKNK
jgi:hypothetical protein